jgi:alkyl sulfatase BDS1-like metallo-beta-lactamase superfamily hydrolase
VELSNATLTNIEGRQAVNPDLTITLNRSDLNRVMRGVSSFDDLIREGKAAFVGNRKPFDQFCGLLVPFTPDFEVLPGTAPLPVEKTAQAAESPGVTPPDAGE